MVGIEILFLSKQKAVVKVIPDEIRAEFERVVNEFDQKCFRNFRKVCTKRPALRLDNRLRQFVKYLSRKHEVTVLSINDWWKGKNIESAEKVTVTTDMLLVMLDYCLQLKRATLG